MGGAHRHHADELHRHRRVRGCCVASGHATVWLIAIGVGIVFEALLIVAKLALRDNSRDSLGWGASLIDMATNTAGVYWWAPGLPTVPGISDALAALAIDPAGGLARVLVSALVGAFLSAAPVWLLPLALEGRDGG